MKQILQALRSGEIEVADVPCPRVSPGHLLIQTRASLISAGTERMIVEFSKASLVAKARQKPERVKKVLDKIRTDGLLPTLEAVFAKLDEPMPLGYCNAGVVLEVGRGVENFKPGDGVVSNGHHAEMVNVPVNLCAKTPDGVPDEQAAFTVLGAIALQGIRLLNPTLGESIVVTGLGLVGLLTVQLLVANGCRVLGIDIDPSRLKLAERFGAQTVDLSAGADAVASATAFNQGRGVDGVLVTASTKDDTIMHESAQMCRKRGRVVLVGVVGLNLHRSDYYEKELTFQVSCSYGPGRYDPSYEAGGQDYPLSFVRWTEQRNFEAILKLMESGRLDVDSLISHRIKHSDAVEAYRLLTDGRDVVGIVLTYSEKEVSRAHVVTLPGTTATTTAAGKVVVGMIGAGNFAKAVLLPALKRCNAEMHTIASAGGVTALHAGRKFGFRQTTTDSKSLLSDPAINLTVIATRHDAHARLAVDSLEAGKHTFVEKPLALNVDDLQRVHQAYRQANGLQLMVGFNRRFAPLVITLHKLLAARAEPLCMSMIVNAGALPGDHWALDPVLGGGRIIGEACHWVDLMVSLTGSLVTSVTAKMIGRPPATGAAEDNMSLTMSFDDGSIGTIHYFPSGNRSYPKERLEVFSDGRVAVLDNFRTLRGYGFRGFRKKSLRRMDKGHQNEIVELLTRLASGGDPLIPFEQLANVTLTTFAAIESARTGKTISINAGILDEASTPTAPAEHGTGA